MAKEIEWVATEAVREAEKKVQKLREQKAECDAKILHWEDDWHSHRKLPNDVLLSIDRLQKRRSAITSDLRYAEAEVAAERAKLDAAVETFLAKLDEPIRHARFHKWNSPTVFNVQDAACINEALKDVIYADDDEESAQKFIFDTVLHKMINGGLDSQYFYSSDERREFLDRINELSEEEAAEVLEKIAALKESPEADLATGLREVGLTI